MARTVDDFIDLSLNRRQSGHPGGSQSKVRMLLALMLSRPYHRRDSPRNPCDACNARS